MSALRYYDQVGLLRPARVDEWTGYRYYAAYQLTTLNRILALRDLGFSLEEVRRLLDENLPTSELRGMLRLRQSQARSAIDAEQARLSRVEMRLQQIETEGKMSDYDVVIKRVDPFPTAYASGAVQDHKLSSFAGSVAAEGELVNEIAQVCDVMVARLRRLLEEKKTRSTGPWFLMLDQRDDDIQLRMVTPVERIPAGGQLIEADAGFAELDGAEQMVSVLHYGEYGTLLKAYMALGRWIEENGYQVAGPCREIYIHHDAKNQPPKHIVEVQFPVERS